MATKRFRSDIADAVERKLRDEARRSEIAIAWLRAVALLFSLVFLVTGYVAPALLKPAPLANVALNGLWGAWAVAILAILQRGWYRPWLRWLLPLMDALALLTILVNLIETQGAQPRFLVNSALGCALLVVSGGFRLSRRAVFFCALLGAADFLIIASVADYGLIEKLFATSLILVTGAFALMMTRLVRRALDAEIARTVLSRFLPERVIQEAHENPVRLLTRPRSLEATVLITDLRGFTALSEHLSPAEVLDFLNQLQGTLAAVVRAHGGMVDKFMGDGMMAVFGAPESQLDHARRALAATSAILDELEELNRHRLVDGLGPLELGIGVHSGPVVVGCLGSGLKLEFTVIGDTVNTAARLESLTKKQRHPALLSCETLKLAQQAGFDGSTCRVCMQLVGELPIRGRQQPIEVHTLFRPGGAPEAGELSDVEPEPLPELQEAE